MDLVVVVGLDQQISVLHKEADRAFNLLHLDGNPIGRFQADRNVLLEAENNLVNRGTKKEFSREWSPVDVDVEPGAAEIKIKI